MKETSIGNSFPESDFSEPGRLFVEATDIAVLSDLREAEGNAPADGSKKAQSVSKAEVGLDIGVAM